MRNKKRNKYVTPGAVCSVTKQPPFKGVLLRLRTLRNSGVTGCVIVR